MASSSSSAQPRDENHAFSGIEPEGIRRKVSKSTTLYDVFINHRGPDSKYSLALPLYTSLKELGIRAFLDLEEMELGQSFPSTIETAINSAAVHIAIFSKRYAESPWCLAELVLMLQSPAKIIPIFYGVEPSALRYIEKGIYSDAFIGYQKKSRYLDKLHKWKEALQSISFTTGYEMNDSNIGEHKSILSAVQREVQRIKPLHVAKYPVALDKLAQDFERRCLHNLVQDYETHCGMNKEEEGKAKIAGIFGMGGVGKTTLSKELFNRKRQQYDQACFLFDVREASSGVKLPSLQTKFLKDLFGEKDLNFQSTEEGLSCISNCIKRSSSLSLLIVLDDIDHLKQLDNFSIKEILEKPGDSLVIITTRDVGILIGEGINVGYHLKGMDKDDARQLFSWHAFSQPHPAGGYEELVDDFLGVCGGLPLSLQVLGSHVHGRDENKWRSELQKLGRTMHQDVRTSLKISFDALDMEQKQIFMDMACFFVDQSKCIAINVWKASGWSAENGLQALKDKCLIEEIEGPVPVLRMHDHLRDLGREMANELSQPRRLWRPQDLKNMESKRFENIIAQTKGRCFHSIFDESLNFEAKFFLVESDGSTEMSSCLLLLHLWYPYIYSRPYSSELNHPRHAQHESLRVEPGIPSWIPLRHMQCLRISNGYFKRLWPHDIEAPSELKTLEIYRTFLEEYPDFLGIITHVEKKAEEEASEGKKMSKIKSLIVKTSRRLSGTPPVTYTRDSSTFKAQSDCGQQSATVKAPLSLLEDLVFDEQENIKGIVLNGTYIPGLRSLELSSMKNLIKVQLARVEKLNRLIVSKCVFLKILSVTSDLTKLEALSISACPMLEKPNLGHLSCLKKIRIADCNMDSVPGISSFEMLVELSVSRCPKLHELCLAHLSCLEKLEVKDCDHLKSVIGLSDLKKLVEVSISWCWILQLDLHLVGLNSLKRIKLDKFVKVKSFELIGCKNLETLSEISFELIQVVNISGCPELKDLDFLDSRNQGCLELIIINGCRELNHLRLTACRILKRVSGNFDLNELSIFNCPMLEELPSFEHLIYLKKIHIFQCGSLQNMTVPTTLKHLELHSCRELKKMVGFSGLTKLEELNIRNCPQLQLKLDLSSLNPLKSITIVECCNVCIIALPITLIELKVQQCMKVQFKSGIDHLTNLRELHITDCPVIERMPVVCGLCCLERITLDGLSKCSYLQVTDCAILKAVRGKLDFGYLAQLWISDCPELEELPCFAHLTCMEEIRILRCSKLRKVTLPRSLKNLQLDSCKELKNLPEISELTNLVELIISQCGQLELELHLEAIDSLQIIKFDGCRKLKYLLLKKCQNLKSVFVNFDVERISVGGCHELEELLICDCPGLGFLKLINIESCDKLQNITLPAKVTNLIVQRCRHLSGIAGINDLSKLTELAITECPEFELLFLAELSCLEKIVINSCEKLSTIILPVSVVKIIVQWCRNLQMIAGIGNLSKLTEPCLSKLEDLTVLFGLNSLESIKINGCQKLNCLKLADCGISEGSSCDFDVGHLVQLKILNCLALPKLTDLCIVECEQVEGLLDLAGLSCLERINISSCDKLHSITLPRRIIRVIVHRCRELQWITAIGSLPKFRYLCISECEDLEKLPDLAGLSDLIVDSCQKLNRVASPTTVAKLSLQRCRNLQTVTAMGLLRKLTKLHISECPVIEEIPVVCHLKCLKSIIIDASGKFSSLYVTECAILKAVTVNLGMGRLAQVWISDCPELEELPGFSDLTCLVAIGILRCRKLQKVTFPRTLKNLQLEACNKLKSMSEISHLKNLEELIISGCGQVELELHLEGMNALQKITFGCSWKMIVIDSCEKLQSILLATALIKLKVHRCRELRVIKGISIGTELEVLSISECPELEDLPGVVSQSRLINLRVHRCRNFVLF